MLSAAPWTGIERAIREATGAPFAIDSRASAGGGCINECHVVRGGGRSFFVKLNAPDRAEMFSAEAAGLAVTPDGLRGRSGAEPSG